MSSLLPSSYSTARDLCLHNTLCLPVPAGPVLALAAAEGEER